MTETDNLDIYGEKVARFGKLAKSKGFDKEYIIKPACIIAASKEMLENYGNEIEAMDKVIELCEEMNDGEKLLQAVLKLAGIE